MSLAGNLFIVGPFEVGMPYIAYSRLPEGAAAFGVIMAAFGGGSLLGPRRRVDPARPRDPRDSASWSSRRSVLAGLGVAAMAAVQHDARRPRS